MLCLEKIFLCLCLAIGSVDGTLIYVGYAVVKLVEALRYKPKGRGFDS
jgi:hypothetical protein